MSKIGGSSGIGLDTAVYIGIAADVVLAIIAGVLIYWWRKRNNDEQKRQRRERYMADQRANVRTDLASMDVSSDPEAMTQDQRQVHAVVPLQRSTISNMHPEQKDGNSSDVERLEGNFAFLNSHTQQPSASSTNEVYDATDSDIPPAGELRRSQVRFRDDESVEEDEGVHYGANSDERVIQNPLAASITTQTTILAGNENLDPEQQGAMAVNTYYTYSPPSDEVNGEASDAFSDGERSSQVFQEPPPPATPPLPSPPNHLDLNRVTLVDPGSGSDVSAPHTPPPPSPPEYHSDDSPEMISNPLYETVGSVSDRASGHDGDDEDEIQNNSKRLSTINFGEEDVAKLYNTELDESTDIL